MQTIRATARQLRAQIEAQHARRVSEILGCRVTVSRYADTRAASGRYQGIRVPVFAMPAELVEQAQMLGLRAEGVQR